MSIRKRLFIAISLLACSSAWADGFKCVALDGSVSFQSTPCASGKQEPLNIAGPTTGRAHGASGMMASSTPFDVAVIENYLHDMAVRCPLKDGAGFMMEVVVMALAPMTRGLSAQQLTAAEGKANQQAAAALATNKAANCMAAEAKIEAVGNTLQRAQQQQQQQQHR